MEYLFIQLMQLPSSCYYHNWTVTINSSSCGPVWKNNWPSLIWSKKKNLCLEFLCYCHQHGWSLSITTGILTRNVCFGWMTLRLRFSALMTPGGCGVKKEEINVEDHLKLTNIGEDLLWAFSSSSLELWQHPWHWTIWITLLIFKKK